MFACIDSIWADTIVRINKLGSGDPYMGNPSWYYQIGTDGRYIDFSSYATNQVDNDTNGEEGVLSMTGYRVKLHA